MSNDERNAREYDIVVWGATGFTGRLVAEYLLRHHGAGKDLRWALGGRSRAKLEQVRQELCSVDADAAKLPLLIGDATDRKSIELIVASTRVIATTVGPFSLHGREMIAACAELGTHYCDLTGEAPFVRAAIEAHHARAAQTGARLVPCSGYDSIPSDLGTLMMQDEMLARHGVRCVKVKNFAGEARGGVSGGTIASVILSIENAGRDPKVRKLMGNPYSLDPGFVGPDKRDQLGVRFDEDLGQWTGPFLMAAINTRVVRRSNALLGRAWGEKFSYEESMSCGAGPKGFATASLLTAGIGAAFATLSVAPLRRFLQQRVLPSPGEGPSKEARDRGYFVNRLVGIGPTGQKLYGIVRGVSDPGYGETAKMMGETALSLARDPLTSPGGVLTPAAAMGQHLITRLRNAGMTFEVSSSLLLRRRLGWCAR